MKVSEIVAAQHRRKEADSAANIAEAVAKNKPVWDAISEASKNSVLNSKDPVTTTGVFDAVFGDCEAVWITVDGHVHALNGKWITNFLVDPLVHDIVRTLNKTDKVEFTSHNFRITAMRKIE